MKGYEDGRFAMSERLQMARAEIEWLERELAKEKMLNTSIKTLAPGRFYSASDIDSLVHELDVLLNGEAGAAKQAMLCDIVAQVRCFVMSVNAAKRRSAP